MFFSFCSLHAYRLLITHTIRQWPLYNFFSCIDILSSISKKASIWYALHQILNCFDVFVNLLNTSNCDCYFCFHLSPSPGSHPACFAPSGGGRSSFYEYFSPPIIPPLALSVNLFPLHILNHG